MSVLTIRVRQLPEGVYLATSEDLPGLIVETDTRDQIVGEARLVTAELLELDGHERPRSSRLSFIFDD